MRSRSPKSSKLDTVLAMYLCKFEVNLSIDAEDRVNTICFKLIFDISWSTYLANEVMVADI